MDKITGFIKVGRKLSPYRAICERVKDFREVSLLPSKKHSQEQASRCMDCGVPFCHWACPIANYIPEWNDLVFNKKWRKAFVYLDATNNLPEVTGRICPALCEYSCVLGINDDPVAIRENELAVIEEAFKGKFIKARPPVKRTDKRIAVVGSGPAGISCADQLNKAGHNVVVFEKDDSPGGILRYGIPDFKLQKNILDRRIKILEKRGIEFRTQIQIGKDYSGFRLKENFDAVCLSCGSSVPRDLKIKGRDLKGIYFAMDYLIQANKRIKKESFSRNQLIDAKGKNVLVIGGGDTGADCVGVANRQGANCVVQIEIMPKPASCRTEDFPWPKYPLILKTSSSHEEGVERDWEVSTEEFLGVEGGVKEVKCVRVKIDKDNSGCFSIHKIENSEFKIKTDLVILALGFLHTQRKGLVEELSLELDNKGNIKTDLSFMTSKKGIFSCGDMRRGQSLVVWAISEGRRAAYYIDKYLMGNSRLPFI